MGPVHAISSSAYLTSTVAPASSSSALSLSASSRGTPYLIGLRCAVDEVLGLLEAQARGRLDDLDHLDLGCAGGGRARRRTRSSPPRPRHRRRRRRRRAAGDRDRGCGSGDAELLLERLHQVGEIEDAHALDLLDPLLDGHRRHRSSFQERRRVRRDSSRVVRPRRPLPSAAGPGRVRPRGRAAGVPARCEAADRREHPRHEMGQSCSRGGSVARLLDAVGVERRAVEVRAAQCELAGRAGEVATASWPLPPGRRGRARRPSGPTSNRPAPRGPAPRAAMRASVFLAIRNWAPLGAKAIPQVASSRPRRGRSGRRRSSASRRRSSSVSAPTISSLRLLEHCHLLRLVRAHLAGGGRTTREGALRNAVRSTSAGLLPSRGCRLSSAWGWFHGVKVARFRQSGSADPRCSRSRSRMRPGRLDAGAHRRRERDRVRCSGPSPRRA